MIPANVTLNALTRSMTSCSIPIPAKAAHWLALRDQIATRLDTDAPEDLFATVADLSAKDISATIDKLTRERVESQDRARVTNDMIEVTAGNAIRAIRTERDTIITTARKTFAEAIKTLTANAAEYSPDDRPEVVLNRGASVAAAWTAIHESTPTLDAHLSLWVDLYGRPASADTIAATFNGDHWQRVDAQAAFDSPNRWHALAMEGVDFQLNTYAEALKVGDGTPEKALRVESVPMGGVRAVVQVRS